MLVLDGRDWMKSIVLITHSPPKLKVSFGTIFTLSILKAFRMQTIE